MQSNEATGEGLDGVMHQEEKPKAVVLMTYNFVEGFKDGSYGDGRLLVYSYDKRLRSSGCIDAAKEITERFYRDFNLRKEADRFEHIFVYSGMNALEESLSAARMIGHDWKHGEEEKKVTLVACTCDAQKKRDACHRSYTIRMILSECGGEETMGRIAKQILEGKDPRSIGNYARSG